MVISPRAISPYRGTAWRLVEAQHLVSTLKLVDSLAEQEMLEAALEESKPRLPPECRGLDYLLATPFRYGAAYPYGSRFRRAGKTLGVFYCAEAVETALAEMAFYRLLFFAESPDTPLPANATDYTAFSVALSVERSVDLTHAAMADEGDWRDPVDYADCQALADSARAEGIDVIRYASVRDPGAGANLAVLTCTAFSAPAPTGRQTWKLRVGPGVVQAVCEFPRMSLEFSRTDFAGDPRLG
ncbi:RES family NAD+ phosphorylase [Devosia sp. SD17-2]|uniref:RES family NAD+ phosphorylase n=1 Tax=Devosia sp. SD17-2 TaxID=2976459 RepID=UPI0023D8C1E6|nr:RES family NAD+ phosphorylase [Devosia sp. SD17-2]WEJ33205.1 RES family NAD+ phosphorylase [Devosia sp. SD17-2]